MLSPVPNSSLTMSGVGLSRPSWRVDFGLVLVTTALVLAGIQLSATPGIDGCVVGLQNPQLRSAGESLPNKKGPVCARSQMVGVRVLPVGLPLQSRRRSPKRDALQDAPACVTSPSASQPETPRRPRRSCGSGLKPRGRRWVIQQGASVTAACIKKHRPEDLAFEPTTG